MTDNLSPEQKADEEAGRDPAGQALEATPSSPSVSPLTGFDPSRMAMANTDREIWREVDGDYYSLSIHVTAAGAVGINVGGTVCVRTLRQWHSLAGCPYCGGSGDVHRADSGDAQPQQHPESTHD